MLTTKSLGIEKSKMNLPDILHTALRPTTPSSQLTIILALLRLTLRFREPLRLALSCGTIRLLDIGLGTVISGPSIVVLGRFLCLNDLYLSSSLMCVPNTSKEQYIPNIKSFKNLKSKQTDEVCDI